LVFSYGVFPARCGEEVEDWGSVARQWLREHKVPGAMAMLVAGPSPRNPDANYRLEFVRIEDTPQRVSVSAEP
jgi:pyruvate kinase